MTRARSSRSSSDERAQLRLDEWATCRSFGALSFLQRLDISQKCVDKRKHEMTIENANCVMDAASAYLRELCPPGTEFVLIVSTTGADGRSISYETSLPIERAADMLREALELAREENA